MNPSYDEGTMMAVDDGMVITTNEFEEEQLSSSHHGLTNGNENGNNRYQQTIGGGIASVPMIRGMSNNSTCSSNSSSNSMMMDNSSNNNNSSSYSKPSLSIMINGINPTGGGSGGDNNGNRQRGASTPSSYSYVSNATTNDSITTPRTNQNGNGNTSNLSSYQTSPNPYSSYQGMNNNSNINGSSRDEMMMNMMIMQPKDSNNSSSDDGSSVNSGSSTSNRSNSSNSGNNSTSNHTRVNLQSVITTANSNNGAGRERGATWSFSPGSPSLNRGGNSREMVGGSPRKRGRPKKFIDDYIVGSGIDYHHNNHLNGNIRHQLALPQQHPQHQQQQQQYSANSGTFPNNTLVGSTVGGMTSTATTASTNVSGSMMIGIIPSSSSIASNMIRPAVSSNSSEQLMGNSYFLQQQPGNIAPRIMTMEGNTNMSYLQQFQQGEQKQQQLQQQLQRQPQQVEQQYQSASIPTIATSMSPSMTAAKALVSTPLPSVSSANSSALSPTYSLLEQQTIAQVKIPEFLTSVVGSSLTFEEDNSPSTFSHVTSSSSSSASSVTYNAATTSNTTNTVC
jgi:hypothetical protein